MRIRVFVVLVASSLATCVSAQQPVITSFESDGMLTWSNAYSDAIASIERLTDVYTTGSAVTVTETLAVSDGSTAVYNYTVDHPPIVNPSVTITDGIYSWTEAGSSAPTDFLGYVGSYEAGQVSAIYLSGPTASGTVIEVEYSYLPVVTQEWLGVYTTLPTSELTQASVNMGKGVGLFRVRNTPSPLVLVPGGRNSGTNPLGIDLTYGPEEHSDCFYPASYSLSVDPFYMGRHEVTIALWDEVAEWGASHGYDLTTTQGPGWDGPDHPVQSVTWYMCAKWCNALSEMQAWAPAYYENAERTLVYRSGNVDVQDDWVRWDTGYRLPTDKEWEYAARGGLVSRRFPWGDTISHSQANYRGRGYDYDLSDGYHPTYYTGDPPYTSPVGSFAPNAFGLYDMAGNVLEWCHNEHPCQSPRRVMLGGDWGRGPWACRIGSWDYKQPGGSESQLGFRVVLPAGT